MSEVNQNNITGSRGRDMPFFEDVLNTTEESGQAMDFMPLRMSLILVMKM